MPQRLFSESMIAGTVFSRHSFTAASSFFDAITVADITTTAFLKPICQNRLSIFTPFSSPLLVSVKKTFPPFSVTDRFFFLA